MRIFAIILLLLGCLNTRAQHFGSFIGPHFNNSALTNAFYVMGNGIIISNAIQGIVISNGITTFGSINFRRNSDSKNFFIFNSGNSTTLGTDNSIQDGGTYSVISGGNLNTISSNETYAVIGGGGANTIGAPSGNSIGTPYAVIGGGLANWIRDPYTNLFTSSSVIAGGRGNLMDSNAFNAVISGGLSNSIAVGVTNSFIPGGASNRLAASGTFAIGQFITNSTENTGKIGYGANAMTIDASGNLAAVGTISGNGTGVTNAPCLSWSGTSGNITLPAGTYFLPPNNTASNCVAFTSDATAGTRSPTTRQVSLRNLYVVCGDPGVGHTVTVTIMTNGVATDIVATASHTTTANDTTHFRPIIAGVEVGIRVVLDASATAAKVAWSFEGN